MTRIFSRTGSGRSLATANAIVLVFRNHFRWMISALVIALVVVASSRPPAVQSFGPPFLDAPTNLRVIKASATGITLTWDGPINSGPFTVYLLERSNSMSGPFEVRAVNGSKVTDTLVTNSRTYVYRVRNLGSGSVYSAPSNMAVGTAISFEFGQDLEAETEANVIEKLRNKTIKAQHIYALRTAINAMRLAANLPDAIWARDNLNGQVIRASDVQELRNRLDEALLNMNIPVIPYADHNLLTGITKVMAAHIVQLQMRSTKGTSQSVGPLYGTVSRAVGGEFAAPSPLPLVPVHVSVLPNEKVLFWGRDLMKENGQYLTDSDGDVLQMTGRSEAHVWDTAAKTFSRVDNPFTNLFCSGHSFLPDGNLFVTGGHKSPLFDRAGEDETNIFNYASNTWTEGPVMNNGRWYPYNVTLNTGELLVMAGDYWSNEPPEPYNPTATPSPRPTFSPNVVPQIYTPITGGTFREVAPAPEGRLTFYPYLHLTPNGRIFQAQSGFFPETDTVDQQSKLFDPELNQWTSPGLPDTILPHAMGSSVLFDKDKVLLIGGFETGKTPTTGVEFINLTGTPQWTQVAPMNFPRVYHTATILPDGKVLVTGGVGCRGGNNIESYAQNNVLECSAGQIMIPELWDPGTDKWTKMAAHQEIRAYHSVAALLPDGKVLVGGGGLPGAVGEIGNDGVPITDANSTKTNGFPFGHNNVEIYSPPYLFDSLGNTAPRPSITSAPLNVTYGETFFVGTSGAGIEPKVRLVRLPSVTHGFNQDQRLVSLDHSVVLTTGGINVTAPASSNECPPGYYMLFVLKGGVPSIARIIRVQNQFLFPTAVPATTAPGQGATWEQGVEFSSSVAGEVTHIRFWKAPGEPSGGHVGRLWTAAGVLLAWVTFGPETSSGWQEARLQTPVQIIPGHKYKVTYNIHSVVAKTFNVFTHPITSGPLVSWGASFSTPAGSFPTQGSTSNLFADVRFKSPQ